MTVETKIDLTGEDITPNKDGGVLKKVLREGTGDDRPLSGDKVLVHYAGTLADGTPFDSSRERGEKFSFDVGKGSVIKGWDLGVPTMRRGELCRLIIRSEYGYGENGSPPTIPGGATLVFEVELFDFHGEDISEKSDKSVTRRVITPGSGYTTPNDGARCVLALRGSEAASGRVFDQRDNVECEIGDCARHNILPALEHALLKFKLGERSQIAIQAKSAWGSVGHSEFGVPPDCNVVYEVELKSFEKAKESWQLNGKEKLEQSELYKNKGTELFKEGKYELALKKYKKIIDFLQTEVYDLDEEKSTASKLLLAANLNVAACALKTKDFREVIDMCNKVLETDAKNEKGLFRMAQAYFGLGEFNDAIKYFGLVAEVNPANKEAITHIALSKQKIKESHEKEKALYSKMCSVFTSK